MTTGPADTADTGLPPSDAELITASREGSAQAYAELYSRHKGSAYGLARQLARSAAEADDLVSEAFAKLLDTLRSGRGPDSAFRAYLLTALRHCAYDRTRRERRVELSDDVTAYDSGVPFTDTAVAGLDRSLAARAFARLPERWQTVLWHTEIEGQTPAEVAPLLGLTPNGVSALAYRAREGLRQAYLQVHLADTAIAGVPNRELERCRAASERLGAWTRGGLSRRETVQVEHHLDECDRCRALAAELADVNGGLRVFIAPLVLGGAATAYLATAGAKTAAAGVAGGLGSLASLGPRQVAAVGGSAVALTAALIVGLMAGPTEQADPLAAPPPPATSVPASPPGQPPTTGPSRPPTTTTTTAPTTTTEQQPAPTTTSAPAAPGRRSLRAAGPGGPVELEAGGAPVSVPITVENDGTEPSDPVAVQLTLPPGVTATGGGTTTQAAPRFGAGDLGWATRQLAQGGITCTGGVGTIRCTTAQGLQPGGSARFVFTLSAALDAIDGVITGTVTGAGVDVALGAMRVVVRKAPSMLDLSAATAQEGPWRMMLDLTAANPGRTAGPVTATIALPDDVFLAGYTPGCLGVHGTISCTGRLAPGQSVTWPLLLGSHKRVDSNLTATAVLGAARRSITVPVRLSPPCFWAPGQKPGCPPGHGLN